MEQSLRAYTKCSHTQEKGFSEEDSMFEDSDHDVVQKKFLGSDNPQPRCRRKYLPVDLEPVTIPCSLTELSPLQKHRLQCCKLLIVAQHSRSSKVYDLDKVIQGKN